MNPFDSTYSGKDTKGGRPDDLQVDQELRPNDILIPVSVDKNNVITSVYAVNCAEVPETGRRNVLDLSGSHLQHGLAGLSVQRGLLDQTLQNGYTATLLKLADSIDRCDSHTRCHGSRTSLWARALAKRWGCNAMEVDDISLSARLHDVGKVVVPIDILTKPSRLTNQEWAVMQRHPTYGAVLMEPSVQLRMLTPNVRSHHEHYDGSGYPMGLAGEDIPLGARMITIADTFTTMTEGRIYRAPTSISDTLIELKRCAGSQFDPQLVEVFIDLVRSEISLDGGHSI